MIPASTEAEEIVRSIKDGTECMGSFKPVRNMRQHRLFFAMLHLLVDNSPLFDTIESAKLALKIATHEVDVYVDETGRPYYVPRSLRVESMPQDRFHRFFNRAIYVILTRWLIGTDEKALRQEIEQMVDGPYVIGKRLPKKEDDE